MRHLKYLVLLAALVLPAAYSQAQVAIGVQIGPTYGIYNAPPVCEYGFYPNYPFACAPYGYWGPEWFAGGVFIGAGPWNHFYFTHAGFYRPFYVNQGFGFRGGDRFRSFGNGGRGFREGGGQTFRNGGGQTFRGDSARGGFRGNGGQSFRDGGGSGVRSGGGRGFSGSSGQSRGSSSQSRGSSGQSRGSSGQSRGSSGQSHGGGGQSRSSGGGRSQSHGGGGDHGGHR